MRKKKFSDEQQVVLLLKDIDPDRLKEIKILIVNALILLNERERIGLRSTSSMVN